MGDEHTFTLDEGLVVRPLSGIEELRGACRIYREVFSYTGEDQGLNPRLLLSLTQHGGSVVGAVNPAGVVLAMAYGWTAVDQSPADPHVYHFSQAAVVAASLQGKGVGRAMKKVQAAVAASAGATRMRWTYDPLLSRNAHFNLDVLGARGRWFVQDAQGLPGTDRITVEWALTDDSRSTDSHTAPDSPTGGDTQELVIPAVKPLAGVDDELIQQLRDRFQQLFAAGYVAVSCRRLGEDQAVYEFRRPQ